MAEEPSNHEGHTHEDEAPKWIIEQERSLVEKGYTPHNRNTSGIGHVVHDRYWDRNANHINWPEAVIIIALLAFVLLVVKVPG